MAVVSYTSGRAQSEVPVTKHGHGLVCVSYGTVEIATIGDATSTYTMSKLPGDSLIVGGYLVADKELEESATETLVLDVGVTGAATAIIDGVVNEINDTATIARVQIGKALGQPLGFYHPFIPVAGAYDVGTSDVNLIVTVQTAATTTGIGTLSTVCYYTQKPYPATPAQTTD